MESSRVKSFQSRLRVNKTPAVSSRHLANKNLAISSNGSLFREIAALFNVRSMEETV